ncbi:hypothetical protein DAEQUDRAFT_727393 [Daedalea quercina L-15889]|uniref:Copper-fist domain-containing protein n=1 Tax=Daedalea quercina L-15889 TaxID=1314783 RepID=A0A165PXP8_9APHY|nr:hypothetical protein DAEQUDRAFT_727393 [Daedalea quercina L-15889]
MVYVNDQKFACESCIKGHRSSSCQHTDRPLFEIKKKGRPVSQCEKCRELRKTKRMHNRCTCGSGSSIVPCVQNPSSSSSKSRRFKPIAPALPNGLKSLPPETVQSPPQAGPSAKVTTSPRSCSCGGTECLCVKTAMQLPGTVSAPHLSQRSENGLAALAAAAAICSSHGHLSADHGATSLRSVFAMSAKATALDQQHCPTLVSDQPPKYLPERPSPEGYPSPRKRRRSTSDDAETSGTSHLRLLDERGLQLPPIRYPGLPSGSSSPVAAVPVFPPIPSLREIASFAGSGCCCGVECACPGCIQHRGPSYASKDVPDCVDGCGTCVDNESGVALPSPHTGASSSVDPGLNTNFIDAFFARAALLPPPPTTRTAALDATNVTVYPTTLFKGDPKDRGARGAAFGLVSLPPLQCGCGGGCGCPAGRCGCGESCGGCC